MKTLNNSYNPTKPRKKSCASTAIILLTNREKRKFFFEIVLKIPHCTTSVIKTVEKENYSGCYQKWSNVSFVF